MLAVEALAEPAAALVAALPACAVASVTLAAALLAFVVAVAALAEPDVALAAAAEADTAAAEALDAALDAAAVDVFLAVIVSAIAALTTKTEASTLTLLAAVFAASV